MPRSQMVPAGVERGVGNRLVIVGTVDGEMVEMVVSDRLAATILPKLEDQLRARWGE